MRQLSLTFIPPVLLMLLRPSADPQGLHIPQQNSQSNFSESFDSSFVTIFPPTPLPLEAGYDIANGGTSERAEVAPVYVLLENKNDTGKQNTEVATISELLLRGEEELIEDEPLADESRKRAASELSRKELSPNLEIEQTVSEHGEKITYSDLSKKQASLDLEEKRALSGYVGFPYRYEHVPKLTKRVGVRKTQRVPVQLSVQDIMDRNDDDHVVMTFGVQQPIQDIIPGLVQQGQEHPQLERPHQQTQHHQHQLHHHPHHHQQEHRHPTGRPATQMSQTEIDFIGILAAIALKLLISTALASWFLFAGQSLYSIASVTGTTAVFGQDSSLGYIYKTLPLVEAILRESAIGDACSYSGSCGYAGSSDKYVCTLGVCQCRPDLELKYSQSLDPFCVEIPLIQALLDSCNQTSCKDNSRCVDRQTAMNMNVSICYCEEGFIRLDDQCRKVSYQDVLQPCSAPTTGPVLSCDVNRYSLCKDGKCVCFDKYFANTTSGNCEPMDNYVKAYNLSEYRVRPNEYCKKSNHCLDGLECKDYQCQCPSPCRYNKTLEVCDCGGIEKPSVIGPVVAGIILGLLITCSWCHRIYLTVDNFHESRGRIIRAPNNNVPERMPNSSVPGPVTVSGAVNYPQVKPPFGPYPPNGGYRYPPPPQNAMYAYPTGTAYPRTPGQCQPQHQFPHTATPGPGYKPQMGNVNLPVYTETSNPQEYNNTPRRPRSPPPPYEETVSDSQSLKQAPPTESDRKPEGDDEKQSARPASAVSVSAVSYRAVSGHGAPGSRGGRQTPDIPPNVSI